MIDNTAAIVIAFLLVIAACISTWALARLSMPRGYRRPPTPPPPPSGTEKRPRRALVEISRLYEVKVYSADRTTVYAMLFYTRGKAMEWIEAQGLSDSEIVDMTINH